MSAGAPSSERAGGSELTAGAKPGGAPVVVSVALARAHAALAILEQATPRLSDDDVARYHAHTSRNPQSAELWRAAHIALRVVLERCAGMGTRGARFARQPGGRPCLVATPQLARPPRFSISHAGSMALIAVSLDQFVGIDIEQPRTVRMTDVRRVAIETAALRLAPRCRLPDEADARFLQAWVRLEAAAKATGEGIGRVLTQAGAVGGRRETFADSAAMRLAVRDLVVAPHVYAAVAAAELPDSVPVVALPITLAGLEAFAAGREA